MLRRPRTYADERSDVAGREEQASVAAVFSSVLGRTDIPPQSTFVSLGGDSLNYVECSVRLEQLLGHLPRDWHLQSVADLDASERRRGLPRLDTSAVLRTAGILAIVATHMSLWYFPGGAHLLLAVVGYNLSRFHLSIDHTGDRIRASLRTLGRVAAPVVAFVGVCMLFVGGLQPPDTDPRQQLSRPRGPRGRALALLVHRGAGPARRC